MGTSHFSGPVYSRNGFYGPTYTYATLPAATSVAAGTQFWTSDNGVMVSNGTSWISVYGDDKPQDALTTIIMGNSIVAAQTNGASGRGTSWGIKAEVQIANSLAGCPLKFTRMTTAPVVSSPYDRDRWGTFGYSGQICDTIVSTAKTSFYPYLTVDNITPQVVVAGALLENDIGVGSGRTTAQCIASVNQFITDIQARYPGIIVLLCTPHPSVNYNTPSKVATYQAMVTYMQGLDNGVNIFTSTLNTYENPASPGTPLPGFTDGVHPYGNGSMRNARVIAATLRRIAASVRQSFQTVSKNMSFIGSGAASGTNVSGTVPTSVTISGSANGTFVGSAEDPYFLQTTTAVAASGGADVSTTYQASMTLTSIGGSYSPTASTQLGPFVEFEIVSGASNLQWLQFEPRYNDNLGSDQFAKFITINSAETAEGYPELQNGDKFLFRVPPRLITDIPTMTGSVFTALTNYFRFIPAPAGGTFAVRFKTAGIGIVVP